MTFPYFCPFTSTIFSQALHEYLYLFLSGMHPMHILYVEDEAKIADFVCAGLKEQGFVVDYCDNGNDGSLRALDGKL